MAEVKIYHPSYLKVNTLPFTEAHHLVNVMRQTEGTQFVILDGQGGKHTAKLGATTDLHKCLFNITSSALQPKDDWHIHLAIAPPKNIERLEWLIEKAVELGVHQLSLITTDRTLKSHYKPDRLEKIVISAMKQCGLMFMPTIHYNKTITSLLTAIDDTDVFVAHLIDKTTPFITSIAPPNSKYLVFVGPEGDFTPAEVATIEASGGKAVTLGKHTLRTETAGIASVAWLSGLNYAHNK